MSGLLGGGSSIPAPTSMTPTPTIIDPTDSKIDEGRRRKVATSMAGQLDRPKLGINTLLGQNQSLGL